MHWILLLVFWCGWWAHLVDEALFGDWSFTGKLVTAIPVGVAAWAFAWFVDKYIVAPRFGRREEDE